MNAYGERSFVRERRGCMPGLNLRTDDDLYFVGVINVEEIDYGINCSRHFRAGFYNIKDFEVRLEEVNGMVVWCTCRGRRSPLDMVKY